MVSVNNWQIDETNLYKATIWIFFALIFSIFNLNKAERKRVVEFVLVRKGTGA
jgi:hypothetical protein